eukprot:2950691-Lingulodinium_polyedra.AAC.1
MERWRPALLEDWGFPSTCLQSGKSVKNREKDSLMLEFSHELKTQAAKRSAAAFLAALTHQ